MMRSVRMRSGWTRWAVRTPSSLLMAVSTRNPAFRRALRKMSVSVGESSTISAAAVVPAGTLGCPGTVWDLREETFHVDATIACPCWSVPAKTSGLPAGVASYRPQPLVPGKRLRGTCPSGQIRSALRVVVRIAPSPSRHLARGLRDGQARPYTCYSVFLSHPDRHVCLI